MNTFTFTDDELELLISSVSIDYAETISANQSKLLENLLNKLERKSIVVGYADEDGSVTSHPKEKEGDS